MRILVVGPTSNPPSPRKIPHLRKLAFPNTELELISVGKGPAAIESDEDVALATPHILRKIEEMKNDGSISRYDAVLLSCGKDPGVDEVREVLEIPVIGTGAPAHLMAALLGNRYSILMPGKEGKRPITGHRIVRKLGLHSKVASIRGVGMPILDIREEAIKGDFKKSKRLFIKAARKAVEEDGADVIVPGCGYFSELAEEVQKDIDVPVLDNVGVALKIAELLVYIGLTHNRITSSKE